MVGRWRQDFDAGRQRVRDALDGRAPRQQQRAAGPAGREEPFINAVLYDTAPQHEQAAAGESAMAAEIAGLRALLAELREVAEGAVARNVELETMLTETTHCADRLAEVLRLPGVRKTLLGFHPDRHPEADENQRRALTEAVAKINAAYDLIDRAANQAP
jgi:hypothetical protein